MRFLFDIAKSRVVDPALISHCSRNQPVVCARHVTFTRKLSYPSTPRSSTSRLDPHQIPHNMAPTVSRSSSQSKISDSFRAGAKATKPLKQTKQAVKPITQDPVESVESEEQDSAHLNSKDPKLISAARAIEKNRQAPFGMSLVKSELMTVHPEDQNTIRTILRNFDLTPKYGPCVGITRLDRYRRAEKMGLKPPVEVLQILETEEGQQSWNTDLFSQKSAI